MHFLISLLGLASLGLNLFPAQCAAVPAIALVSRSDNNVNHENLVVRSVSRSAREYGVDEDEGKEKGFVSRSAHRYDVDSDEEEKRSVSRSAHRYDVDSDEEEKGKRFVSRSAHRYDVDSDEEEK
ncbi:MAG: hypothetical protein LQ346_007633 [Caloplaca aetnensis]|nr:MAG: hypothetical protein LQ346_007633 [Caloplaca aetnensis]